MTMRSAIYKQVPIRLTFLGEDPLRNHYNKISTLLGKLHGARGRNAAKVRATLSLFSETHLKIDLGTRVILNVLQAIEDEHAMKQFHAFVPKLLPAFYAAFTCSETDAHGRAQILEAFYLCLRTISWADGIDNDLVSACLDDQFNTWMALFQQLIQTNAKSFFEIKKNALKCLTVVFRDFINYSRDCISKILEPAWKLLNFHLPVFTEVLGYGQSLREFRGPEDDQDDEHEAGFESDDEEEV